MIKKGRFLYIISFLIFTSLFFLGVIIFIIIRELNYYNVIMSKYTLLCMSILFIASLVITLITLYNKKKIIIEKIDWDTFNSNKNYYRDIIKNYSVSELNYIDKFKLDKNQEYTSKLIELQREKFIRIVNNYIIVISEPTSDVDIKFVKSIKNNKVTINFEEYEALVINSALGKKLLERRERNLFAKLEIFGYILIEICIILLFYFSASKFVFDSFNKIGMINVIFMIISLLIIGISIYILFYDIRRNKSKLYRIAPKGKEIKEKLHQLKCFMQEYSKKDNNVSSNLLFWDEYIIYSVMFDINRNIQEEYTRLFIEKSGDNNE